MKACLDSKTITIEKEITCNGYIVCGTVSAIVTKCIDEIFDGEDGIVYDVSDFVFEIQNAFIEKSLFELNITGNYFLELFKKNVRYDDSEFIEEAF